MSEVAKKNDSGMLKLTGTLGAICAVCALALGMVNYFTEPMIAEVQEKKKTAAISAEVMPGFSGTLTLVNYTGSDKNVRSVQKAGEDGFIVEVSAPGSFSGVLTLMVGVDNDKSVTGVSVLESQESPGFGSKASDPEIRAQFVGKTAETVKLVKDGGELDGISGATITSRALVAGVSSAIAATDETNDGPYVPVEKPEEEEPAPAEPIPGYTGELTAVEYGGFDTTVHSISQAGDQGYVVEVAPEGSYEAGLVIQVGVSMDQVVLGVVITESNETPSIGGRAAEPEFLDQFVGKTGEVKLVVDGGEVEGVSGATLTSQAVTAGVSAALAAVATLG